VLALFMHRVIEISIEKLQGGMSGFNFAQIIFHLLFVELSIGVKYARLVRSYFRKNVMAF
jgi:hypothetical protein